MGERIAKIIARAGLCSRREAERWIEEGKVSIAGEIITSPALNIENPDSILVNGTPLPSKEATKLWLYHKPTGLITSHNDPQGRDTVFDALPDKLRHVISIGRLDLMTEGLLLLTNNGELSHHLESPQTGWVRHYRVRVYGDVNREKLAALKNGITIPDPETKKPVHYAGIHATLDKASKGKNSWIKVALTEGKNREIRRVCEHMGLSVSRLIRVSYGPFELGTLKTGALKEVEKTILKKHCGIFLEA